MSNLEEIKATTVFPMGEENKMFEKFFIGKSWFAHLAIEVPAEGATNEWLEPVTDEEYGRLI